MFSKLRLVRTAAGISLGLVPAIAFADFTPNRLAVLNADATGATTNAEEVRVQQFSKSGTSQTPSFTVTLPSSGGAPLLTMSGDTTNNADGALDLSGDGKYLSLAGYNQPAGTTSVAVTSGSRILGRIDYAGNINLTTSNNDTGAAGLRTIASADGSRFWISGAGGTGMSFAGVFTAALGSTSGTTVESGSGTGAKALHVFNGQLYGITNMNFFTYPSPPLPSGAEARTTIPSFTFSGGGADFYLLDRDATVSGLDTLYIVGGGGLKKYSFDGSTWTARGSLSGNYLGIAAEVDSTSADLYLIDGTNTSANTLVSLSDTAAFNSNLSTTSIVTLATAAAGTEFRNVEFTPVPEPASFGLLLFAAAGTVVRRRKGNRK